MTREEEIKFLLYIVKNNGRRPYFDGAYEVDKRSPKYCGSICPIGVEINAAVTGNCMQGYVKEKAIELLREYDPECLMEELL